MKKIKYILKRLKTVSWKNYWETSKKISKITKKPTIIVWFDILKCTLKFGSGYTEYLEFEFYLLNDEEKSTYLTASINNQIIAKYNKKEYRDEFSNKLEFNKRFKKYIKRDYIDLTTASLDDFKKFVSNKDKIIAKVIDSSGGEGIEIYKVNKDIKSLYNNIINKKQYLVEEVIKQHKKMSELYDKSVNTLRIITFITDDGNVKVLNKILKIGNGENLDNGCLGGMYTFLDDKGKVIVPAIDNKGNTFEVHPISNTKIVGFQIPNFDKVIKLVKDLALIEKNIRYVGWDIAITQNDVDVVEGNEYSGLFQIKPSLNKEHTGLLPLYRKYMDI